MADDTVYAAIRSFLETNWTATKMVFDNEDLASDGETRCQDGTDPWMLVEMTGNIYEQGSIGAGDPDQDLWRQRGQLLVEVMVKRGTGSRVARQHAKAFVDLFRGLELIGGQLTFGDSSIGVGQIAEIDGNWFALPTATDFQMDE